MSETFIREPELATIEIRVGHYVRGPSAIQRYAYLCNPCPHAELARWEELTGRGAVEDEAEGVAA